MLTKFENIWIPIKNYINIDNNIQFEKFQTFFMKSTDICYFIGEIDFNTYNINDTIYQINLNIPELDYDFIKSENTIFSTKTKEGDINSPYNSIVRIELSPKSLVLIGTFEKDCFYEFNIQLFMRMKNYISSLEL
jgi:hypothetical protein